MPVDLAQFPGKEQTTLYPLAALRAIEAMLYTPVENFLRDRTLTGLFKPELAALWGLLEL